MITEEKGFTLVELLVVIGIIAVLSIVVVLTLNPAELLRQSRDSNRIADMSTLKSALSLYLSDVSSPNLASSTITGGTTAYSKCFQTVASTGASCGYGFSTVTSSTASTSRAVNSSGWLPVAFTDISSGSPVGLLPVDPLNDNTHFYAYAATSSNFTFKLVAVKLESNKFTSGSTDVVSTDGGNFPTAYETGSNLNL